MRDHGAGRGDHGGGVGVTVCVDADDVLDVACQRGHAVSRSNEPIDVGTNLAAITT
jgi:hypothetical protein